MAQRKARPISAASLAELINDDCQNRRLFWACGLIKETLVIWGKPEHRDLLCEEAQVILDHYLSSETTEGK